MKNKKLKFDDKLDSNTQFNAGKKSNNEYIKNRLMQQYNLTNDEAEKVLKNIKEINSKQHGQTNRNTMANKQNVKKPLQTNKKQTSTQRKNVDSILSDIIPDYNKQISIELNNVSLSFEVTYDKIDNIKESFIRTLKRNKSKKETLDVLKNISFKIYKGEKVGIIGYNGAGKSTLLNVICGIYPPDTGEVKTFGNISPLLSLGAGFDINYSGRKNILLNGAVLGYDRKFLESKMEEIIDFSELNEFIDLPIKNYSSGMLAKLGFSIATIVNPDILIIDEILGVGDINFQKKSNDKIKSLMDGQTTVILVSHSITQIKDICDKVIWIDQGKVKEIGDSKIVCDNYIKDSEKASQEQIKNIKFK